MSNTKIVMLVLAACGALGIALIGACAGLGFYAFKSANSTVGPEIDRLFAAIDNDTFAETYESDTAPEFRKQTSKEQYADIGKAVKNRLGPLKSKTMTGFNIRQHNADAYVDVAYNASFEKGKGTIAAKMKKQGGQWKIVTLRVNSPAFEKDLATATCPKCGAPHARDAKFCPACGARLTDDDKPAEDSKEKTADDNRGSG